MTDIFDIVLDVDESKVPTFLQWCKSVQNRKKTKVLHLVSLIWIPGKYPNYTIRTESFRYHIYEDSPIFKPFTDRIETFIENQTCLAVRVLSVKDRTCKLDQLENESAHWEQIGESGYRLTILDKK